DHIRNDAAHSLLDFLRRFALQREQTAKLSEKIRVLTVQADGHDLFPAGSRPKNRSMGDAGLGVNPDSEPQLKLRSRRSCPHARQHLPATAHPPLPTFTPYRPPPPPTTP